MSKQRRAARAQVQRTLDWRDLVAALWVLGTLAAFLRQFLAAVAG